MELTPCPSCGAFSPESAKECQECHAPLPEEPAAPPVIAAAAPEPPPAAEPEPKGPAPFEAAPEVLARVRQIEAVIAQKPTAPAPYLQLAQLYVEARRQDLAIATLERVLALEPKNTYLRHRLAQLKGVPEPAAPVAAAPAAARTGAHRMASFQPVQRPPAPPPRRLLGGLSRERKLTVAGGLLLLGLLVVAKLWLFPSTRRLVAGSFRAYAPVWSPAGTQFAFLLDEGQTTRLAVYDFAKGAHRVVGPASGFEGQACSWSPDGSRLAWSGPGGEGDWQQAIFVADAAGGQPRRLGSGSSPRWSSDGSTLLAVCMSEPRYPDESEDGVAYPVEELGEHYCRIDVASGDVQMLRLAPRFGGSLSASYESVVFEQGPGEDQAAAAAGPTPGQEFDEFVGNVAAGGARNVAEGSRDLSRALEARKYDERRKAARTAERLPYGGDVFVASLSGSEPVALTTGGQSAFPAWAEDGSRILFAANGATGVEFHSVRPDGGDRQTVLAGVKGVDPGSVRLSQDGREVFFVAAVPGDEGMARTMTGESPADLHVAPVGGTPKRLSNRHPFKQRYAVSPDGRRIVYEVLQDLKLVEGAGRSELWLMRR